MKTTERYLYLDDIRYPHWTYINPEKYDTARSYDEFVKYITDNGMPAFISFDHDLADQHYDIAIESYLDGEEGIPYDKYTEKTGLDCAKWLVQYCIDNAVELPTYKVHSANPVGKANIEGYLQGYKKFKDENTNA